jgi:hypothetical protein
LGFGQTATSTVTRFNAKINTPLGVPTSSVTDQRRPGIFGRWTAPVAHGTESSPTCADNPPTSLVAKAGDDRRGESRIALAMFLTEAWHRGG